MPAYDLGRVFDFRRWPPDHLDRLVLRLTFRTPANDDAPVGRRSTESATAPPSPAGHGYRMWLARASRLPLSRAAGEGGERGTREPGEGIFIERPSAGEG
jgi:hypothetical protein